MPPIKPSQLKRLWPQVKLNIPISTCTTFGVGGRVAGYLKVKSSKELVAVVRMARENQVPYLIIAGGSNVVFGDQKFHGLVIHYLTTIKSAAANYHCQGLTLTAEAGLPLADLIKSAIAHGLAGLEALSGIPGTVGGAIVGNAGAYGQCISDHLVAVKIFDPNLKHSVSKKRWISKKQCRFAYRDSVFKKNRGKDWLVLRVKFKLEKGNKKLLAKKSREIIKIREKKYPPGLRCPGSFFKNVLVKNVAKKSLAKIDPSKIRDGKIPAGYLLESVGAKGLKFGNIKIADFHGNLLINNGHVTFAEVQNLATLLKSRVKKQFGIKLEEEVRYMIY